MIRNIINSDKNALIKWTLFAWMIMSGIAVVMASVAMLLANNATDAMIFNALKSDDFNVWGMISTVITSGGYIKSASLNAMIVFVAASYVSLYFSTSILNMYIKDIPIKTLFSSSYWTRFYQGSVLYDNYETTKKVKKRL